MPGSKLRLVRHLSKLAAKKKKNASSTNGSATAPSSDVPESLPGESTEENDNNYDGDDEGDEEHEKPEDGRRNAFEIVRTVELQEKTAAACRQRAQHAKIARVVRKALGKSPKENPPKPPMPPARPLRDFGHVQLPSTLQTFRANPELHRQQCARLGGEIVLFSYLDANIVSHDFAYQTLL